MSWIFPGFDPVAVNAVGALDYRDSPGDIIFDAMVAPPSVNNMAAAVRCFAMVG